MSTLSLHFDTVDVALDGSNLTSLRAEGMDAKAVGSLPRVALELGAWSKRFPNAYALPLAASGVSFAWKPSANEDPWLVAERRHACQDGGRQYVRC